MKTMHVILCLGAMLGAALPVSVSAAQTVPATPPTHYKLNEMNFDMWCQETMHYPADRCDKRLPEDDKAFQAYVGTVQKYEVPYQQQRRQEQERNKDILHYDPVDSPQQPDANAPQ
ncbi:MAG: hypothetical protein KGR48_01170 [Alphaproteobacteria bacterium]|nr:hypothetical protein [Alphaproteobacteria bacterium]MBU6471108.1 hypothetical protein [Alphaproteobacteria bacterium]MDE2012185.1 hypothetical protein [Alphaproteobacteria bacterium]MDE2072198.1 hypothetical protein [Alphaproteobacteria bacterium]MDE2351753.1 hypothetical protein [Alphaproteobacteria bacterium]